LTYDNEYFVSDTNTYKYYFHYSAQLAHWRVSVRIAEYVKKPVIE
jgi:hypothetical protein